MRWIDEHLKGLMLLCACSISMGSHFGTYQLGPLKSILIAHMEISNTDFSSLISSITLVNTLSPLLGFVVPKYGPAKAAMLSTGLVALGLLIVWFEEARGSLNGMILGFLIFGSCTSFLSVCQETIIVTYIGRERLGLWIAIALLLGRLSAWFSSVSAVPLSETSSGLSAVFGTACCLGLVSLSAAISFAYLEHRYAQTRIEVTPHHKEKKHIVAISETLELGDAFWTYCVLNIFCGTFWHGFTHLSSSVLHTIYNTSLELSAIFASISLASSLVLYPLIGLLVDRLPPTGMFHLMLLSGFCTLTTFVVLRSDNLSFLLGPLTSVAPFAMGYGFAPVLIVIMASRIVEHRYVSTALGMHKALEMAGATLMQLLAGKVLDKENATLGAVRDVLGLFLGANIIQLLLAFTFWRIGRNVVNAREAQYQQEYSLVRPDEDVGPSTEDYASSPMQKHAEQFGLASPAERLRGKVSLVICATTIAAAWFFFAMSRM